MQLHWELYLEPIRKHDDFLTLIVILHVAKFCQGAKAPQNVYEYIMYQPRRRLNIVQSLVGLRWVTSLSRCRNEAKTRNRLKFAGVPQTGKPISVVSGAKFAILWGHLEEILLFNKFFSIVDTCPSCEDTARQSSAMVGRWRIFGGFCVLYFSEPRAVHSDLRLKFALRPHHVWKYGSHPICDGWD